MQQHSNYTNDVVSINAITNDTIFNNFIHLANIPQLEHNKNELLRLLTSYNTITYVAYCDDKIIGYLVGEDKQLNDGRIVFYISYIYIGKNYRGMKLGSKFMSLIIDKSKSKGVTFDKGLSQEEIENIEVKFNFSFMLYLLP